MSSHSSLLSSSSFSFSFPSSLRIVSLPSRYTPSSLSPIQCHALEEVLSGVVIATTSSLIIGTTIALYKLTAASLTYYTKKRLYNDIPKYTIGSSPFSRLLIGTPQDKQEFYDEMRDPGNPHRYPPIQRLGFDMRGEMVIAVSDADMIATILGDIKTYKKVPSSATTDIVGSGLVMSEGELWHRQRKLLTPLFHFKALKAYQDIFLEEAEMKIQQLSREIMIKCKSSTTPPPYSVTLKQHDIHNWTLHTIIAASFSNHFNADQMQSRWDRVFGSMSYFVGKEMFGRLWDFIPLPCGAGIKLAIGKIRQQLRTELKRRLAILQQATPATKKGGGGGDNDDDSSKVDLMDFLIACENEMSIELMIDESLTFLLAGHETTGSLIAWTLLDIAMHPVLQTRLREEITTVVGKGGVLTSELLPKLELLKATIKESLRLHGPVPLLDRSVSTTTKLGDYTLPKGTTIWTLFFAVHEDERHYDKPLEFNPDRWMSTPTTPAATEGLHSHGFIPFSAGPRGCIGSKFALNEAEVHLWAIVSNFTIALPQRLRHVKRFLPDIKVVSAPEDFEVELTPLEKGGD